MTHNTNNYCISYQSQEYKFKGSHLLQVDCAGSQTEGGVHSHVPLWQDVPRKLHVSGSDEQSSPRLPATDKDFQETHERI